ncbi:unnamed protein product [Lactuca virosa]|uniref:Legume lectin domain-containing protein n=1 Tax=Lactuca virosa TaxID=75947 RepID=A0AAU9PVN0_9ASTR|nr:unnamed protein product [Lactuca virosa]
MMFLFLFLIVEVSAIIPSFKVPRSNFTQHGTAFQYDDALVLTEMHCAVHRSATQTGRIHHAIPIKFLDHSFQPFSFFYSKLQFSVNCQPRQCPPGDGLALVVTSDSSLFASESSGSFGLPADKLHDLSFVAFEFDTSYDEVFSDLNANHVGVNINSLMSMAAVDLNTHGMKLTSGVQITAWISYSQPDTLIQIWMSYSSTKPHHPILTVPVDLSTYFTGYIFVGLTASNRGGSSSHIVHSWYFKSSESPYIAGEAAGPEFCDVCFPGPRRYLIDFTITNVLFFFGVPALIIVSRSVWSYTLRQAKRVRVSFDDAGLSLSLVYDHKPPHTTSVDLISFSKDGRGGEKGMFQTLKQFEGYMYAKCL